MTYPPPMKSILLTLLLSSFSLSACVTLGSFNSFDKDANGRITREEASHADDLASAFDYGDSDQDGYLTPAEFDAAKELVLSLRDPHDSASGGGGQSGGGHKH